MDYIKIIPCLDLEDPIASARYYNDSGADEIAYFDSKATKEGREPNIRQIREITRIVDIPLLACGGVRDVEDAKKILYAGANKVCMNSAAIANPDIVKEISEKFGRNRIIVAIDLSTKENPVEWAQTMEEKGAGELLLIHNNHVENYVEIVNEIKNKVRVPIIISSYATKAEDMKELIEKTEADSISLYSLEKMDIMEMKQELADANIEVKTYESALDFSTFKLDENGLIPVIVQDYKTHEVLMMAYMNEESYEKTIRTGKMTYFSRSRQQLWTKGETSGHYQYIKSLTLDCDNDTILAKVSQIGAACHTGNKTCFFQPLMSREYDDTNPLNVLENVYSVIRDRKDHLKGGSYTNYLFEKGIDKILKKLGEQATGIVVAAKNPNQDEIKYEISDLLYYLMVLMAERDIVWKDVTDDLADRR